MQVREINVLTSEETARAALPGELADGTIDAPSLVPAISDRQFAARLRDLAIITQAEAVAYVGRGELPASLAALVAALPSQQAREDAELLLAGATTFDRTNPYVALIGGAFGWSSDQIDDFFRAAAAL